jgi:hypothetical protein
MNPTRRSLPALFLFAAAALGPARARAEGEPINTPAAACFANPERWSFQRGKDALVEVGDRFLADLKACGATRLADAIEESERYRLQANEAAVFARHSRYVMLAYGVAWGLLALSALALFFRQRRVSSQLAEIEDKVRAADTKQGAA